MPLGRAPGGLGALERCLRTPDERGLVFVEGPAEELPAVERHLTRRARSVGRAVVGAGALPAADGFREVARKLGVGGQLDPRGVAREIVARARGAAVFVVEDVPTQWGSRVAEAIEQEAEAGGCLVVVLTVRAPEGTGARIFELGPELLAGDVRLWLEAVVNDPGEPCAPPLGGIRALEAWWAAARRTPAGARAPAPVLDEDERQIVDRLAISQRSWSEQDAARLGPRGALLRLLGRTVLSLDGLGRVTAGPRFPEPTAKPLAADAAAVAELLEATAQDDPWSLARASELHALAGDAARSDRAMARALATAPDASSREDLWARHDAILSAASPDEAAELRLSAAERALRLGDVDRALAFARKAAADQGETFPAMWALGQASSAGGDLTTAAIALDKARALAPDASARVRVSVEQAEVRYQLGDLAEARRLAEEGLGADAATRLSARNVLGKLHLADGAWAEAELHFAADAHDAACAGDVTAELRARLNRAVSLFWMDRHHEAQALLLGVVEDGARKNEPRAVARGLYTLAAAAHRRQDYAEALQRYGEALDLAQRLGQVIQFANLILGRAELGVRLNLLAEAEQALAFGRRVCGPGIPGALVMGFEIVAAHIHLARKRTEEAGTAVRAALKHRGSAVAGDRVGECYLLAARIALEEGDVTQTEEALASAREWARTPRAAAEVALLGALSARAVGSPFLEPALEALNLARQAESFDLVLEAHLVLASLHADARKPALARVNLAGAAEIRDRMARGLPDDVRARFLEREDFAELARLSEAVSAMRESVAMGNPVGVPQTPPTSVQASVQAPVQGRPERRLLGNDPTIVALRAAIQRIGAVDETVLIHGESGTGKELVAEALHEASARRRGPLLKVNCAALAEGVLLSELFGHEKGAFTGAVARRQGRFELAGRGTLFLDEIGDVSPDVQKSLLRVLQEGTFERVGSAVSLRSDCRVVCATHRDLASLVAAGRFREDLYYRLHGIVLHVPPLRSRQGDLPLLCSAIVGRLAQKQGLSPKKLSAGALAGLGRHPWPGNVRELENALRSAMVFAAGDTIELDDFTRHVPTLRYLAEEVPCQEAVEPAPETPVTTGSPVGAPRAAEAADDGTALLDATWALVRTKRVSLRAAQDLIERECIAKALAEAGGNITQAAKQLGMGRSRLSQLVTQYRFRTKEDES